MSKQTIHKFDSSHTALYEHASDDGSIHGQSTKFEYNGIEIPASVIRQLKMMNDDSLHMTSDHVIDKAYRNFLATGNIVRDVNGGDIHDMMHLHWGEQPDSNKWDIEAPDHIDQDFDSHHMTATNGFTSNNTGFVERLANENNPKNKRLGVQRLDQAFPPLKPS